MVYKLRSLFFVKNGSIIRGKNCRIIQWNFLQKLFVFPVLIQPGIKLSEQINTLRGVVFLFYNTLQERIEFNPYYYKEIIDFQSTICVTFLKGRNIRD